MIGQTTYRRMPTSELIPTEPSDYVDIGILEFFDEVAFGPNLILRGPKGAGKTLNIEVWAARRGIPFVRQPCTAETGEKQLIGSTHMTAEGSYFQLGAMPAAIDVANAEGACLLVLEEINTLDAQLQKNLNAMTDYRQAIEVPRVGRVFRVNPGCKVWTLGTMNPNYTGTYNLNEDLNSRFSTIDIGYMPQEKELELLLKQFPSQPLAADRELARSLLTFAAETRSGALGYALSTRDLVEFLRNYARLKSLARTLKLLEGKWSADKLADIRARVQATFRENITATKLYGK